MLQGGFCSAAEREKERGEGQSVPPIQNRTARPRRNTSASASSAVRRNQHPKNRRDGRLCSCRGAACCAPTGSFLCIQIGTCRDARCGLLCRHGQLHSNGENEKPPPARSWQLRPRTHLSYSR